MGENGPEGYAGAKVKTILVSWSVVFFSVDLTILTISSISNNPSWFAFQGQSGAPGLSGPAGAYGDKVKCAILI